MNIHEEVLQSISRSNPVKLLQFNTLRTNKVYFKNEMLVQDMRLKIIYHIDDNSKKKNILLIDKENSFAKLSPL